MPITIHSPHSGKPIKVRPEDVGRALRDDEGRVFYVVQRPDGSGYYGAKTRAGSQQEAQAYEELVAAALAGGAGGVGAGGVNGGGPQTMSNPAMAAAAGAEAYDATGASRSWPWLRSIVLLIFVGIIVTLLAWGCYALTEPPASVPGGVSPPASPTVPGSGGMPEPKSESRKVESQKSQVATVPARPPPVLRPSDLPTFDLRLSDLPTFRLSGTPWPVAA